MNCRGHAIRLHPNLSLRRSTGRPAAIATPALALVLALSACSVGPAYRRPDIAAPAGWRTPPAAPSGSATTGAPARAAWPSVDWWSGFHSAELARLIGEGRRANDDLAAAIAR